MHATLIAAVVLVVLAVGINGNVVPAEVSEAEVAAAPWVNCRYYCPRGPAFHEPFQPCGDACSEDSQCAPAHKCCTRGCGESRCVKGKVQSNSFLC
ncbi:hypothetical protein BV898_13394 [Hypsibius exemplaris]|uniref:WAP domain-containing protein n=1 Tax=Hypsibius exemplaris TaxID=2072580 RepID=A0A1W0WAW6_HYPEX|nr:hypothetical protein BV898_13394 [Hypsibius exemplaris]